MHRHNQQQSALGSATLTHIARPQSVVILAETVRRAREVLRAQRIDGLKVRVSDGDYAVSSKRLAESVLASFHHA